ncbi:oxidoreductase [Armatimonadota bacterium]|nr:oxidoreductase [Armatimonadota bacterium]
MRAIQYAAPRSLSDAVAILQERGSKARILAGGTDLIVQVGENVRDVDTLVDGKHIPELMEISFDPITGLTLGAAVPCYRIYEHPEIQSHYSGLVDSASIIGGTGIQGRASIGGNLCNSGPAGDTIPTLIAYSAMARILGANGERNVAVEDFCTAPGRNILQPDELLVSIHFPAPPTHFGAAYLRFIPRNEMDIAVVGVGASLALDDAGTIVSARIALAAVAPKPLYVPEVGYFLEGNIPSTELFAEAGDIARSLVTPISDMRGTAAHRKHLTGVLVRRTLQRAFERARA